MLQKSPDGLFCLLEAYKNEYDTPGKARALFDEMKIQLNSADTPDLQKAAAFYVVNKCSFSGLTESSSFSPQASVSNFSMRGIENLPKYSELIQNWKITCAPYWKMMMTSAPVNTFWFLDPPYDIKDNLYGKKGALHKGFNHEEFHAWMTQGNVKDRWMITYNTNPTLVDWYKDYNQTKWDLTYTMRSVGDYMNEQKDRAELLITNYDETNFERLPDFNKSKQEVGSY
jgi:DNA adenine methylase